MDVQVKVWPCQLVGGPSSASPLCAPAAGVPSYVRLARFKWHSRRFVFRNIVFLSIL